MLTDDPFAAFPVEQLFADWRARNGLLLGISGGPDSMALLRLVLHWSKIGGRPPVYAATVDHGLRADSSAEARMVAEWVGALGVPHAILPWEGLKPDSRLQELARDARYALMAAHSARIGADTLMTAHHADDQAETILFRLTRGSGVAGLAGMARESRRGDLLHARPLLDFPKTALVDLCRGLGQPFVTDPSNENPRFARVRLRQLGGVLADEGLGRDEILRLGRRAARANQALVVMTETYARDMDGKRDSGRFSGNMKGLAVAPMEIIMRILGSELTRLTGSRPRFDRLEALALRVHAALAAGVELRATLGGARIVLGRDGACQMAIEEPRRRDLG